MYEEFTVSEVPTVVVSAPLDGDDFEIFRITINEEGDVSISEQEFSPEFLPMVIAGLERMSELLGCDDYDSGVTMTSDELDNIADDLDEGNIPSVSAIRELIRIAKGRFE